MPRLGKQSVAAALLIGFVCFSGFVKLSRWNRSAGTGPLEAGRPAPPFELPNIQGETVDLRSQVAEGRLVVVTFWATWCGPCHAELAQLAQLYREHASEGLKVLAVSIDRDPEVARRYAEQVEIPFVVLLDSTHETLERYRIQTLPTTILIGPESTVIRSIQGLNLYLGPQVEYHLRRSRTDA